MYNSKKKKKKISDKNKNKEKIREPLHVYLCIQNITNPLCLYPHTRMRIVKR